jgi:uncharacterized membrane protein YdjX (TVP38/TMEM64 family)
MAPPAPLRAPLHRALDWPTLWPSVRAGLWVTALFGAALAAVQLWQVPLKGLLAEHRALGIAVFVAASAVAVLLPLLTNLPLVPLAVLAWGPWQTALLLLAGWMIGSALAFALGRHARGAILRHFPSALRHAQIDRLIHPRHRMASLVLLRMSFPVDVLSYALALFSPRTTAWQNLASTTLGAAPFAALFAAFPTLSGAAQVGLLGASLLAFGVYVAWVLERPAGS